MGYRQTTCKCDCKAFAHRKPHEAVTIRPTAFAALESLRILPVVSLPYTPSITCILAVALCVLALRGFKNLRSTTLAAPCLWVALSAGCLAVGALLESRLAGITLSATRFSIAATTLCPLMAVLGAKRPQDRGWQWIVLSLWIVLVWPAAQAVALPAGVRVELFVAWRLFLWGLIALGLLNYLPTIHWRASILVALGQILLLREHLGLSPAASTTISDLVAMLSFLSAAVLVTYTRASEPPTSDLSPLASLTRKWLRFRNHYGAFWALRILGRINHSTEHRNWPIRLEWPGFTQTDSQKSTTEQSAEIAQHEEVEQSLNSMLRRFLHADDA